MLLAFKKAEKGWGASGGAGMAGGAGKGEGDMYLCDVLLPCAPSKSITTATGQEIAVGDGSFQPPREGEKVEYQTVQVPHVLLKDLSSVRIHIPQVGVRAGAREVRGGQTPRSSILNPQV